MENYNDLMNADIARRTAMIAADLVTLANYLSDDLVWTHSSGQTDNKPAILKTISSRSVIYESLETRDTQISKHGDTFIYSGTLLGQVQKKGTSQQMQNKFLSVWKRSDDQMEMLAWQSTGLK
ncbi:MAG: DUF4440 domain-containing protein [Gammaproteobacteria bacterium]|jgi:ketosteroid isomerase-like protein|nr:DUF4440 domain-containing protein [Gammaproteobacteria bacterium]|tara:strand:+ start:288 stop:656 length:369 start_codon:yes stop_codon:yes gene_type:complete